MGNNTLNCCLKKKSKALLADSAAPGTVPLFLPTKYIWIIVTNERYDKRRKEEGFKGYMDLPEVRNDAKTVRKGIKGLGARDKDIIEL